jgi:hypothetical protein
MSRPPSFQEAIAQSAEWIALWDKDELSDDVLADLVGQLVQERDGARGFFVVSLTGKSPLMDRLPEVLLHQLRGAGEQVVDLTVKNLAMSTAMCVLHNRNQEADLLDGSLRVQSRSLDLLRQLDSQLVKARLEKFFRGLEGQGEDQQFLEKWGYDAVQRKKIEEIMMSVPNENQNLR